MIGFAQTDKDFFFFNVEEKNTLNHIIKIKYLSDKYQNHREFIQLI